MNVNSDINILGGLPDWNLVLQFLNTAKGSSEVMEPYHTYTSIKTDKSVKRFEKAITGSLLRFPNKESEQLIQSVLDAEGISPDSLLVLFWNASINNELLHHLNSQVYFPSFYSGRLVIKKDEVSACIKELKETEAGIKAWTIGTIDTVGRKYLTLLKRFNLMDGRVSKTIVHPYLNDKMFILFIYWLTATESKSNLLDSEWFKYSFSEKNVLIERLMQKKFAKYFQLSFTGDKLKVETSIPYTKIYHGLN